jgi:hypothetical protein
VSASCAAVRRVAPRLRVLSAALVVALTVAATALVTVATRVAPVAAAVRTRCASPVAMYHVDALGQLRRWNYAAPLDGSSGWTQQKIGTGWGGLKTVAGGSGVVYAVDSAGDLRWYRDNGYAGTGGAAWDPASGAVIGKGFGRYGTVVSGGQGVIYTIDSAGNLFWHRYLGSGGAADWDPASGTRIGTGWAGLTVAAGGNGELFAVDGSGTLRWYRQIDPLLPSGTWAEGGVGSVVGSGWSGFSQLGSMGGGVLFARDRTGGLHWYRDLDPTGGSPSWANQGSGTPEGTGWNDGTVLADVEGCAAA